ncbi:hypothetical protein X777_01705 [Ooceraea biroi]|uniref:Uncharacterized protein n=1 Tax=Ooceraea biroi TaxID=2015173 RepID=A0A026WPV6_OOCBI|nr:hypothetical protein X777_01705 [Ooceraea biroi]
MKYFTAILLLALFAVAMAENIPEPEKLEPTKEARTDIIRDKRGLYLNTYSPIAYSSYASPIAYSAYSHAYSLPYAYNYSPYRYSYYSPYASYYAY